MQSGGLAGASVQTFPVTLSRVSSGFWPRGKHEGSLVASEILWPCHIWSHVTPSPAPTALSGGEESSICGEPTFTAILLT